MARARNNEGTWKNKHRRADGLENMVFKVPRNFQGAGRIRLWLLVDNILLLRLGGRFIDAANLFLPRRSHRSWLNVNFRIGTNEPPLVSDSCCMATADRTSACGACTLCMTPSSGLDGA